MSEAQASGAAETIGPIEAVLFDFSGVLTSSPWGALSASSDGNLALLVGPYDQDTDHPWHRLERGEVTIEEWLVATQLLAEESGATLDLSPLESLLDTMTIHDDVVDHIRGLRADGYRTALVTNNVREGSDRWRAMLPVDELFEVVVDSSAVGMRKPNPLIYQRTLELLGGVVPERAVFLDDVASNVVAARAVGLHGIVVPDPPAAALVELDALLGR
jgi:putative hydrolase of the HAD superfamily